MMISYFPRFSFHWETIAFCDAQLGLPRIRVADSEGQGKRSIARVQWRPMGLDSTWSEDDSRAWGRLWLRVVDPASDTEKFRRRVDVLPNSFSIQRLIGNGHIAGRYEMGPLFGARIEALPTPPVRVISHGEQAIIECPPVNGNSLPDIDLKLSWPGRAGLSLILPYPQRGASFHLAGHSLHKDDLVPLDRLGGLTLLLQDPAGSSRFWLDGEFIAPPEPHGDQGSRLGFRFNLPPLQNGYRELSAFPWRDQIAAILASSPALEAYLRLEIGTSTGDSVARIRIARFDALIELDKEAKQISITDDTRPRLGSGWESRVVFEMMPLWAPKAEPRRLLPCGDPPTAWLIPDDLAAGPWWVIGRDGDWARFRPLLWNVIAKADCPPNGDSSSSDLVRAIKESNRELRERALHDVLNDQGRDPAHSDWPLLFEFIELTREFPPSSIDALRLLIAHPETIALALLKADGDCFNRVWSLAEQLPFSWSLVPVKVWGVAAQYYFDYLRTVLGDIDPDGDMVFGLFQCFRERTTALRAYWRPLCDWLQERVFPERPLEGGELHLARTPGAAEILESEIQQAERELQSRHDADEHWPQSGELDAWSKIEQRLQSRRYTHLEPMFRPVRFAPFLTAALALQGIAPSSRLVHELRLLRTFDTEWFDTIFAIALTQGLAGLSPEGMP